MLTTEKKSWQALAAHAQELANDKIVDLFHYEPARFKNFSLQQEEMLFDFSKQLVTRQTIKLLCDLARESNLSAAIKNLFSGAIVNQTEQRPALHTELRNPNAQFSEILQVHSQMAEFVDMVHNSNFTDVIVFGIGGSDLGPRLVCEALQPYTVHNIRLHFIGNVDADTLMPLLENLNPITTICLINSKTFTTIETLANANIVKQWLGARALAQIWGITANPEQAKKFGIAAQHIFKFWDWVGGRYSVWSAVGLPIALQIGMANFKRFLAGAHAMDQHFMQTEFEHNIPVLFALLGIWQINFQNYSTLAIQPYADGLQLLPAYLQQLEMESNGKSAGDHGGFVAYQTAPVIWGGVGCNGQHAFMQMLHQGTQVVPSDFIVACRSVTPKPELQDLLVASCLGQTQALMTGRATDEPYKVCPGNRPSNTIMFDQITPENVGKLIALYEHKVFVQGVIWQIQSFDQWGVQLGKDLIKDILHVMQDHDLSKVDSSTAGLIDYYLSRSKIEHCAEA